MSFAAQSCCSVSANRRTELQVQHRRYLTVGSAAQRCRFHCIIHTETQVHNCSMQGVGSLPLQHASLSPLQMNEATAVTREVPVVSCLGNSVRWQKVQSCPTRYANTFGIHTAAVWNCSYDMGCSLGFWAGVADKAEKIWAASGCKTSLYDAHWHRLLACVSNSLLLCTRVLCIVLVT